MPRGKPPPVPSSPPDPATVLTDTFATTRSMRDALMGRFRRLPADADVRQLAKLADTVAGLLTLECRLAGLFATKIELSSVPKTAAEVRAELEMRGLPVPPELAALAGHPGPAAGGVTHGLGRPAGRSGLPVPHPQPPPGVHPRVPGRRAGRPAGRRRLAPRATGRRRAVVRALVAASTAALAAVRRVHDHGLTAAGWQRHHRGFRTGKADPPRPVDPRAVADARQLAECLAAVVAALRSHDAGTRTVARADVRRVRAEHIAGRLAELATPNSTESVG